MKELKRFFIFAIFVAVMGCGIAAASQISSENATGPLGIKIIEFTISRLRNLKKGDVFTSPFCLF